MKQEITELIYKSILGTLDGEGRRRLDAWLGEDPENLRLLRQLSDPEFLAGERRHRRSIDTSRPAADMQHRINAMRRRKYLKRAGAAAAVAVAIWGISMLFRTSPDLGTEVQGTVAAVTESGNDSTFEPGSIRATLSTSDGKSIALDSHDSGSATDQIITVRNESPAEPEQISIEVPRGGEFKIVLEDSTEVWLNCESTLRYPELFAENERRVQVTGEAYFKVRKDPSRPFYVESEGQVVRVYGTSFNIKAYPDEELTYTTLETGTISLRKATGEGGELFLSPGHQAMLDHESLAVDMKVVNPSMIASWRNGRFVFEEQPLKAIMHDLSRWYDFTYEFEDEALRNVVFLGSIPRYADFKTAISIIEKSGGLTFRIEGSHVTIAHKK